MTKRNYGIDLLRITAMFMIVVLHVLGQGGILDNATGTSYWLAWFLEIACYGAVNCYALISGYVMQGTKPKISKLAVLWLQTVFYTLFFAALFAVFQPDSVGLRTLLNALFPVTRSHYWYISAYFGMFLLIPLLNLCLEHMSKRAMRLFLLVCFIGCTILPTVLNSDPFAIRKGFSTAWLCLMYLTGGWICKYDIPQQIKTSHAWILAVSMIIVTFVSMLILETLGTVFPSIKEFSQLLVDYTSPTVVLTAVALLVAFSKCNFGNVIRKLIAFFVPATLGIYLIHTNQLVFENLFDGISLPLLQYNGVIMILLVLVFALLIYLLCSALELLRIRLFRLLKVNDLCQRLEDKLDQLLAQPQ
jgi:surface polysaccharide O-acyltransferase-like enzyme